MRYAAKGFMGAWVVGVVALGSVGCQNKVYDENLKFREENRELRAQNEALTASKGAQAMGPEIQPPAQPESPAPRPAPTTQPERFVATPGPAPAPPARNDLAETGLETSVDPVAGTTTVHLVGDALFDPGKATLKETSKASLDRVAAAVKKQYPGRRVKVQGHTDADPIRHSKWGSNMELSKARADAVRTYLVAKGIDSATVVSEGFGEQKPKTTNPQDKAKNRRVEIVVVTR